MSIDQQTDDFYHEDPATNTGLRKLQERAHFYRFAHAVLTGKFDENFAEWLSKRTVETGKLPADEVETPDLTDVMEWMFTTASVHQLIQLRKKLNELQTVLTAELFGRYSEKNVRGQVPADTNLAEVRAALIKNLDAHKQLINDGMMDYMTVQMIEALPAVGNRRADGTWNFPNAPADKDENEVKTVRPAGTNNFRAHNTTVKLVVDGEIQEHPTLGLACAKIFELSPQDVGKLFEGWHDDYYGDGENEPKKIYHRDERKIFWTTVGD